MQRLQAVKGKFFVAAFAGVLLIGGATAALAASPAGQYMIRSGARADQQSVATTPGAASHKKDTQGAPGGGSACPGLAFAQHLAVAFALSSDSAGDAVQALCALHQGTFQGATPGGTTLTSSRVLGYGEIEMLLTYASYLAGHDRANSGGKLTSSNVRSYLTQALRSCGTSPLEICLKTNIPGFQPGAAHSAGSGTPAPDQDQHGHGHGNGGKPTSTSTSPSHH